MIGAHTVVRRQAITGRAQAMAAIRATRHRGPITVPRRAMRRLRDITVLRKAITGHNEAITGNRNMRSLRPIMAGSHAMRHLKTTLPSKDTAKRVRDMARLRRVVEWELPHGLSSAVCPIRMKTCS